MKKILKLWLKMWLYVMVAIAGVMGGMLIQGWDVLDVPTKSMMFLAITLALHVMEEWRFPGGFYFNYNKLRGSKGEELNHYPMNQITDMITNFSGEIFFIVFLIYGVTERLTVMVFLFCLVECLGHLVLCVKKNIDWYHTFYNPGFTTTLFGFLPLGVYTLTYLIQAKVSVIDMGLGLLYMLIVLIVCIILPEQFLKNKKSIYGYKEDYGYGFYEKYEGK